ncbi:DUF5519 family protein [Bacillus safensis]|uniref:luciferase domain-containing protein n=1 Tax=Bacillus safensis TaxID=561879 RepID=UPI000F88C497|nr:luciferase family protein [Bacillus safensis]MBU5209654.1 hypothetical protein [Bacillus safensis]RUK40450.1 hypothetical protein ELP67_17610 [Bacillus safensis]WCL57889.1 DUF5519 family protein [Bacillus safensis]
MLKSFFKYVPLIIGVTLLGKKDYEEWKKLGKGGVPYNVYGWLLVTYYRFYKRNPIKTDIYNDRLNTREDSVRLGEVEKRKGPRPKIGKHPVPHRQLDQLDSEPGTRALLDEVFNEYVQSHTQCVHYEKSFFEKRNDAITLINKNAGVTLAKETEGEIAHIHPSDGSMHMVFSPSDAKKVIEQGWGERHPLAGVKLNLPDTYLMIYTPRNKAEVLVVKQLLNAAVAHMSAGCTCCTNKEEIK